MCQPNLLIIPTPHALLDIHIFVLYICLYFCFENKAIPSFEENYPVGIKWAFSSVQYMKTK